MLRQYSAPFVLQVFFILLHVFSLPDLETTTRLASAWGMLQFGFIQDYRLDADQSTIVQVRLKQFLPIPDLNNIGYQYSAEHSSRSKRPRVDKGMC